MAHPVFEHPQTSQVWMDKAGIVEVRLIDDRGNTGVWYCNLKTGDGAYSMGLSGEGKTAINALLDAMLKLKAMLDRKASQFTF